MSTFSRFYVSLSFVAGILVTLGLKDFYPDLERRYQQRFGRPKRVGSVHVDDERIELGREYSEPKRLLGFSPEVRDGIEGAIGRTPLIRIRSLSDRTGCDILAKCEVLRTWSCY